MLRRIFYQVCTRFLSSRTSTDESRLSVEKEINIYVGLTEMQRKWYRSVLEKDIDAVNGENQIVFSAAKILMLSPGLTGKKEGKTRLMNMVMQVRTD